MCLDGWVRETEIVAVGLYYLRGARGVIALKAFAWRLPRKENQGYQIHTTSAITQQELHSAIYCTTTTIFNTES